MANPNLLNVLTAYGKTEVFAISTTPTMQCQNPLASNKIYKINSIFVANVNGTSPASVTLSFNRNGVSTPIASTVNIEQDSSLVALGKDTGLYLEEGDSLEFASTVDGYLTGVVSFEILG